MQVIRLSYGIRGFARLSDYAIRWERMVTEQAKRKARILAFWQRHGLEATVEAFGVARRTLFLWKAKQRAGGGRPETLNEGLKRPHRVRKRAWPQGVIDEIRRLRTAHPNLGPEKVAILLAHSFGPDAPRSRTVARIIHDAPDRMRIFPRKVRHNGQIVRRTREKRARKPKHFNARYPGHCGAFDTIERFIHGCRRYVLTFTDLFSRFSFALATTSHASQAAKEFFRVITGVFPYRLDYVLTDNGSEFMKHFDVELRRLHRIHWHAYPKTPKMNAHEERFNRTIQEEFVDFHAPALLNPSTFNDRLIEYLLWYNGERPHWGLDLKSPIQFLTERNPQECSMWWRDTRF